MKMEVIESLGGWPGWGSRSRPVAVKSTSNTQTNQTQRGLIVGLCVVYRRDLAHLTKYLVRLILAV